MVTSTEGCIYHFDINPNFIALGEGPEGARWHCMCSLHWPGASQFHHEILQLEKDILECQNVLKGKTQQVTSYVAKSEGIQTQYNSALQRLAKVELDLSLLENTNVKIGDVDAIFEIINKYDY